MASTVESASLNEIFKNRYVDKPIPLPKWAIIQDRIEFDEKNAVGDQYIVDVQLRYPHGHTYNGPSTRGTAFAINESRAGQTKQAKVSAMEYLNSDLIAYGFISSSQNGQAASFTDGADYTVMNLSESSRYALEEMCMHGGRWIGEISGSGQGDPAPATSGTNDLVIYCTKREWAAGLWALREGSLVDVYSAVGTYPNVVPTTKRNAVGTVEVYAVDGSSRAITLRFSTASERSSVVETDVIIPMNAFGNWANGITQTGMIASTGGTLYTINTALYSLFQASRLSVTGAMNWTKVTALASAITAKGGMRDYVFVVSPWSWNDINNDQAGLRRYTETNGGTFENGADRLLYHGPNGLLEVLSHPMMKAGEGWLVDFEQWRRVGSSEPVFSLRGAGELIQQMPNNAGYQIRQWWDQAPMTIRPSALGIVTGIQPTGLT